ncbi:MAG: hypothetical protein Q9209_005438 [Squamulea sp. 1 TL-2023]
MAFLQVVTWILIWVYAYLAILNSVLWRKYHAARVPPSRFPIDRLPSEILHLVFATADRTDVSNLRLTCKTLAAVGIDHLFQEAELLFTRSSFDRLTTICPIYGRHVKTLVYQVHLLRQHFDMDEYIQGLASSMSRGIYDVGPEWAGLNPPADASNRNRLLYGKNLTSATDPKVRYDKKQLKRGWEAYRKLWLEQEHLRHQSYGEKDVLRILAQLPNLKHITLSNCLLKGDNGSTYFQSTYRDTLMRVAGDGGYGEHCGIPQLLSIVRALHQAGTRIESLKAGLISWQLFKANDKDFELIKKVLHTLKTLKMWFTAGQEYEWEHPNDDQADRSTEEDDECRDFLKSGPGRHIEFLQSLTHLRVVDICFHSYELDCFDIESMFRDIQWPCLREIALSYLQGTDKDLLNFLRKHAATLKVIQLSNYKLTQGLWLYTFREMRESLSLETFRPMGWLENEEHGQKDAWNITNFCDGSRQHREQQSIQQYVQGSQAVSLGDIINHGERCSCQGGPYHDMCISTFGSRDY